MISRQVSNGIEIKDGSYNNIIRDNVIHDTKYPGIIVYGVEEQGGPNIIERNVIWNSGDHAIQVAADAVVKNNLIFTSDKNGIHSQNHQGAIPGNLTIVNNTVRTSENAIEIASPTGGSYSGPITIANNALYPDGGLAMDLSVLTGIALSANVGTGSAPGVSSSGWDGTGDLNADFVDFANLDAFPASGSQLIAAGDAGSQPSDDFNTTLRGGSVDVGAYVYDVAGNPGWQVGPGFKEFPAGALAAVSSVPEPASWMLLLLVVPCFWRR